MRIRLLFAFITGIVPAFPGPIFPSTLTSASLTIPSFQPSDTQTSVSAESNFDRTYNLVVTGSYETGTPGRLYFRVDLHTPGEYRGNYEDVAGGSQIQFGTNPAVFVGAPGGDRGCPPCDGIDFLYGVPFSLRIQARSVVGYTYHRTANSQQTMAGQVLRSSVGTLDFGYVRAGLPVRDDPNATLSEVSGNAVPEPATAATTVFTVLGLVLLKSRLRYG